LTTQATIRGVPVFYKGRRDIGRTPTLSQFDLLVQHRIRLPGHTRVELEGTILNLFDQDARYNQPGAFLGGPHGALQREVHALELSVNHQLRLPAVERRRDF
jgi:hypothetical protein